jgi:hypothetical protein
MVLSGALLASPAFADEDHAFTLDVQEPEPVAPGADGRITYTVTNTSGEAIDGIQINIMVPPDVDLELDPTNCKNIGVSSHGGDLISCDFTGPMGKFAPGESKDLEKTFTVAADAPEGENLGAVGGLVVPLEDGAPTEDWNDTEGPNVDRADIKTSSGGAWDQLKGMFGF